MINNVEQVKVYILDDDRIVAHSLCQILEKSGFDVRSFKSAKECLACCDSNCTGYLLLDHKMPDMTGIEIQELLVERHCPLKVIFISAMGKDIESTALSMGAIKVFVKPFDPNDLVDLLNQECAVSRTHTAS